MISEITAALIMLIGAWIFYRSRKRAFDRKNAFGREIFNSYSGKLMHKTIDISMALFGGFLTLTGLIYLAIEHQDSWGWIVLLPVAYLFLVGYIPGGRR